MKYCSKCKTNKPKDEFYSKLSRKNNSNPLSSYCKTCANYNTSLRQQKVGTERKMFLIREKGGRCSKCGYDKCIRSLSFHHRNPSDKKFCLSMRELSNHTWEKIQQEADKCDLLCMNCHHELHYDETLQVATYTANKHAKNTRICKCGNKCWTEKRICQKCMVIYNRSLKPPLEELLHDIKIHGFVYTGKKYGVSDNAVRKWLKVIYKINCKTLEPL